MAMDQLGLYPGQLAVGLEVVGSWLHWDCGEERDTAGGEEQSYVPAPGRCAQELAAAILSLVTTLPSTPLCPLPAQAHTLLLPPSDGAQEAQLRLIPLPFALVSLQVAGCVIHVLFHGIDCTNNKSFTRLSQFLILSLPSGGSPHFGFSLP